MASLQLGAFFPPETPKVTAAHQAGRVPHFLPSCLYHEGPSCQIRLLGLSVGLSGAPVQQARREAVILCCYRTNLEEACVFASQTRASTKIPGKAPDAAMTFMEFRCRRLASQITFLPATVLIPCLHVEMVVCCPRSREPCVVIWTPSRTFFRARGASWKYHHLFYDSSALTRR